MQQATGTKYDATTRLNLEREWALQGAKSSLGADEWKAWQALKSSHRFFLHVGQTLLLWEVKEGRSEVRDTLRVVDFESCPTNGLTVTIANGAGKEYRLDHTPQLVQGVFLYVPRFCDLQFFTRAGEAEPTLRFGLIARMRNNPNTLLPDTVYVSTPRAMKDLFIPAGVV